MNCRAIGADIFLWGEGIQALLEQVTEKLNGFSKIGEIASIHGSHRHASTLSFVHHSEFTGA
jgi:hypothetical protein